MESVVVQWLRRVTPTRKVPGSRRSTGCARVEKLGEWDFQPRTALTDIRGAVEPVSLTTMYACTQLACSRSTTLVNRLHTHPKPLQRYNHTYKHIT